MLIAAGTIVSRYAVTAQLMPDDSIDLYLGPKAPSGKAGNWLATVPGKGFFAILRLYGPTKAAIERIWKPGDIEPVK